MSDKLVLDDLDQWEDAFERRSVGRTKVLKARCYFSAREPVSTRVRFASLISASEFAPKACRSCRSISIYPLTAFEPFASAD